MQASIKDGVLTITIDTAKKPEPSKSGRSLIVASTRGNIDSGVQVNGKKLIIALNAYVSAT